jgi:hypothetical protein
MTSLSYHGFTITPRTFQVRGSGRWTRDVLIGRNHALRAFCDARTYRSEEAATAACCELARRIIDGTAPGFSVVDLC